jgi:hypothetical protein
VSRGLRGALLALGTLLFTIARSAYAQNALLVVRQASFTFDDKQMLRASIAYHDVVDDATVAKLKGGLPTMIVMSAFVARENGPPLAVATFKSCRVIFDLWDEVYRLEISQAGNPNVVTATPTLEGVLRRCAEVDRLAVVAHSLLTAPDNYHLEGVVEINPVSTDMRERIKRWISRPTGGSTTAPGDALFGSFVGLFVTRIGSADRQVAFRTQTIPR